ncbi:hypothetical protein Agub_g11262, partial [Astrephomene gubernaculifera]
AARADLVLLKKDLGSVQGRLAEEQLWRKEAEQQLRKSRSEYHLLQVDMDTVQEQLRAALEAVEREQTRKQQKQQQQGGGGGGGGDGRLRRAKTARQRHARQQQEEQQQQEEEQQEEEQEEEQQQGGKGA